MPKPPDKNNIKKATSVNCLKFSLEERKCVACSGTGVASNNSKCYPCKGTGVGYYPKPQSILEVENLTGLNCRYKREANGNSEWEVLTPNNFVIMTLGVRNNKLNSVTHAPSMITLINKKNA